MQQTIQGTKNHTQFDYSALPPQQRVSIQKITIEIKESLRKTVRIIWETGKKLAEVRSQVEAYQFNLWLKSEFDWSRRTAYNFISVYEAFPEFASANFAQLNISISALYLLAAPSMHQVTRKKIIDQALSGEYISHKIVQKAIEEVKGRQVNDDSKLPFPSVNESIFLSNYLQSDIENLTPELHNSVAKYRESEFKAVAPVSVCEDFVEACSDLRPAWNLIEKNFSLFWGDTASLRFIDHLPPDAFVLAIPSNKWHHDWLLRKSRNFIILHQPAIKKELLKKILLAFSTDGKAIIFPWLSDWQMIKLALDLNIKVYAGDPELRRCEDVLSKLSLNMSKCVR
jgi:hypothetical protein